MVLGLKSVEKLITSKKNLIVTSKKNLSADRIKVLHGPQTQTYGETSYFKEEPKY